MQESTSVPVSVTAPVLEEVVPVPPAKTCPARLPRVTVMSEPATATERAGQKANAKADDKPDAKEKTATVAPEKSQPGQAAGTPSYIHAKPAPIKRPPYVPSFGLHLTCLQKATPSCRPRVSAHRRRMSIAKAMDCRKWS